MVEIVSPSLVYRLYRRIGMTGISQETALKIIRIDGIISWLLFTILAAWIYGKLP